MSVYVAALRRLAQDCNYGDYLKEMLRDRLVCGINNDRMQLKLLSETGLTFERALVLAQAMETATKDVREIQGKSEDSANMTGKAETGQGSVFQFGTRQSDTPAQQGSIRRCY